MNRLSLLSLLVGGVLPLLVAAVTKASWPEPLKAALLALLSAATGVGSALLNPTGADYVTIIANAALAFVAATAVAAGTWKPTGTLAKLESIFIHDVAPLIEGALPQVLAQRPSAAASSAPVTGEPPQGSHAAAP